MFSATLGHKYAITIRIKGFLKIDYTTFLIIN